MSADDWQTCAKCLEKRKNILKKSYGIVPEEVYNRIKEFVEWTEEGENEEFTCISFDYEQELKKKYNLTQEIKDILNELNTTYDTPYSVRVDYQVTHDDQGEIFVNYGFECEYCEFEGGLIFNTEKHKKLNK